MEKYLYASLGAVLLATHAPVALCSAQQRTMASARAGWSTELEQTSRARYGRIFSVRELADGRVLVTDLAASVEAGKALFVQDASGASTQQLGRPGDGPGEYRSPSALLAMGRDTTWMFDGQNRKWYLLDGMKFVDLGDGMRDLRMKPLLEVNGIDQHGNVLHLQGLGRYQRTEPLRFPYRPEHATSIVLLLHRGAKAADTIATLAGQYFGMTNTRKTINGKSIGYAAMLSPLQTHEQAVLFRTGEIALVHFAPFRVPMSSTCSTRARHASGPSRCPRAPAWSASGCADCMSPNAIRTTRNS
jgi:hypothetical protein